MSRLIINYAYNYVFVTGQDLSVLVKLSHRVDNDYCQRTNTVLYEPSRETPGLQQVVTDHLFPPQTAPRHTCPYNHILLISHFVLEILV